MRKMKEPDTFLGYTADVFIQFFLTIAAVAAVEG
jgi:hypothetical protein